MATVVDDTTGEIVEVQQVEAAVTIASLNALAKELPVDAAQRIEQAMAGAIQLAHVDGVTDPVEVKNRMLSAVESTKRALYNEMLGE